MSTTSFSSHSVGAGQRTNQRAELFGVQNGLEMDLQAATRQPHGADCPTVSYCNFVIATDSKYAVQGITEYLPEWKTNGFRTSNGRLPVNEAQFCEIDETMSNYEELGYGVALWYVPRLFNAIADEIAKEGAAGD
ncbi:ribonuclease H-like domain-containing protein [Phyllosticta citrichinensis]|uniref:Ribonuclease H-like domain-containing protein n=1 Tax=Phyllosticta citrichinensis TaxID=1130410 RepID=A0ABR1XV93_9PEZI